MQKRAVQFAKKPCLPLFSSETADKFARDYTIEKRKSFRHALHLVTAHLHRQNQVAHTLRARDFWLASLSMHFPIHFTPRAHEYPVTLMAAQGEGKKLLQCSQLRQHGEFWHASVSERQRSRPCGQNLRVPFLRTVLPPEVEESAGAMAATARQKSSYLHHQGEFQHPLIHSGQGMIAITAV